MAAAAIRIDQAGHPTQEIGVPGISRRDLSAGLPVTLRNQDDTGVRAWRWRIVTKPKGSTAALSNSIAPVPTFTPDVPGTYLVELTVNEGKKGERTRRIGAVLDSQGLRFPGAGETTEANWNGNTQGWHPDLDEILQATTQSSNLGLVLFSEFGGDPLAADNAQALRDAVAHSNSVGGVTLVLQRGTYVCQVTATSIPITAPLRIVSFSGDVLLDFTGSDVDVFDCRASLMWDRVDAMGWSGATDDLKLVNVTETPSTIPKIRFTNSDLHSAADGWVLFSDRFKADLSEAQGVGSLIIRNCTGFDVAWFAQINTWKCNRVVVTRSHFYDIEENAIWCGRDVADAAKFTSQGDYNIENCIFERIGDGSAQSDPDRHAVIMFGRRARVRGCTIVDVDNDTALDCEGIYAKVSDCIIGYNNLHNAGLGQAAIAVKGQPRGSTTPANNVDVSHNIITNDSLRANASAISIGDGGETVCSFNTIDGMTDTTIVVGGEDQNDVSVVWNRILNTETLIAVSVNAPSSIFRFEHNIVDVINGGASNAVGIQVLNGSSPSVAYQHVRIAHNTFRGFTGSGTHNCGILDNMTQNPSVRLFEIIDNVFDGLEHGIKFVAVAPRHTMLIIEDNDFTGCNQDPPIDGVANLLTTTTRFSNNKGFLSENSGVATFAATDRVTVNHGLHWTRRLERRIQLTPFGGAIPDSGPWLENAGATTFDIVFGANTSRSVGWNINPHLEPFP